MDTGARFVTPGRKQQARAAFDLAITLAPSSFEVYTQIIVVLNRAKMYDESVGYIVQAINIPPRGSWAARELDRFRDSDLYVALGDAYWQLGLTDLSRDAYRRAILLNDQNAVAYNNLGYHYAEAGIRLDEALKLTQRAVELQPGDGCFLDSLGWAYFKLGKHEKAVTLLRKAAKLSPCDPEIRYHLGRAFASVGRVQAARVENKKILWLKQALARPEYGPARRNAP